MLVKHWKRIIKPQGANTLNDTTKLMEVWVKKHYFPETKVKNFNLNVFLAFPLNSLKGISINSVSGSILLK